MVVKEVFSEKVALQLMTRSYQSEKIRRRIFWTMDSMFKYLSGKNLIWWVRGMKASMAGVLWVRAKIA